MAPRRRPAPPRLRPGTPVLAREGDEVQCGTDPRWAFVLTGLDRAEAAWLRELAERRHVPVEQVAARYGVGVERRDAIVDVLARAGVLVPPPTPVGTIVATADGAADAAALGMLRPDGAGLATLATRARRTVGLAGLGRVGAAVATQLATAGIGTLVLHDPLPVQTTDLGLGGLRPADLGLPRHEAVRTLLAECAPLVTVEVDGVGRGDDLDVVVVAEAHAPQPARYRRLMGAGVAHLPVVWREADVLVGPLVRPGRSACVSCLELGRADEDRQWPVLVSQLREAPEPPQETTLAAVAAALTVGQVLALLDGHRPATVGAYLEVALPSGLPRLVPVAPHVRCGCLALPD